MGEVKVTFTVLFFAQIWFVAIVDLFLAIEKKKKKKAEICWTEKIFSLVGS
jgi:uncharacterized membrane protein